MTPEKLLELRQLAGKMFLGTEDIYPLFEGLKLLLGERCTEGVCSRCKSPDNLERVLEWVLCPECRFDAKELFSKQIRAGRLSNTTVGTKGSRWAQVKLLLDRDGFVTCESFRFATGCSSYVARDTLHKYKKRDRLVHDKETKRFTLGVVTENKRLERGVRWNRVLALIARDGYVSSETYSVEYGCKYLHAKSLMSDCRCAGLITTDPKTHKSVLTKAGENERGSVVKTSSIKKVAQHHISSSIQKTG